MTEVTSSWQQMRDPYERPSLADFLLACIAEDEAALVDGGECRCGAVKRPDCADRIAADCEAKRKMVDHLERLAGTMSADSDDVVALRLLALPYADHADYRQEWKP